MLHLDDVMVATDGSKLTEGEVEEFYKKCPFGEWQYVKDTTDIAFAERQISLHGNEIHVGQPDFIKGRMDQVLF